MFYELEQKNDTCWSVKIMGRQMGFRALMVTKSTLKWFAIIGLIITLIGVIISFFSFNGLIVVWIGLLLVAFSFIALLYLWLTDRYLAKPHRDRIPQR